MTTKTDKYFNYSMGVLLILFILVVTYLRIQMNIAEKANNNQPNEFITFEYEVSRIDSEGLYGDSLADNTGIYITHDKLQPNQKLQEGDLIRVYFDSADIVEGIEHVEVVTNE